ncbi:hypothetical protein LFX25_03695 [Leptospira sp. FAT2]|uniref:hypothetical protein n=1 Tax=Leptospira sanjuanensis TaxID=2879643 RepID=UPI001EE84389|nr:hypothetical protein [Leptospira sanjuanensis]MCG6192342.1 hypothetical protein [Leptospira sanjuanensis]
MQTFTSTKDLDEYVEKLEKENYSLDQINSMILDIGFDDIKFTWAEALEVEDVIEISDINPVYSYTFIYSFDFPVYITSHLYEVVKNLSSSKSRENEMNKIFHEILEKGINDKIKDLDGTPYFFEINFFNDGNITSKTLKIISRLDESKNPFILFSIDFEEYL